MPNIFRIDNIAFEGTHFYEDKKFENYIVWLDGFDEPFRMTKCMSITNRKRDIPVTDNLISCEIIGDRLKSVKILYNDSILDLLFNI